jgi:hypothetical protein
MSSVAWSRVAWSRPEARWRHRAVVWTEPARAESVLTRPEELQREKARPLSAQPQLRSPRGAQARADRLAR